MRKRIWSLQEGLKRTIESYSDLRAELLPRKEGPSKAAVYLGNGLGMDNYDINFTFNLLKYFIPRIEMFLFTLVVKDVMRLCCNIVCHIDFKFLLLNFMI